MLPFHDFVCIISITCLSNGAIQFISKNSDQMSILNSDNLSETCAYLTFFIEKRMFVCM